MFSSKKLTYSEQLDGVKNMFTKAFNQAKVIADNIKADIAGKQEQINALNKDIENLNSDYNNTTKFMGNLEQFV